MIEEDIDIYLMFVSSLQLCLQIILIYRRDVSLDICGGALVLVNAARRVTELVDSGARELSIIGLVVEPIKVHRGGDDIFLRSNVRPRSAWIEAHTDVSSSAPDGSKTDVGVIIPRVETREFAIASRKRLCWFIRGFSG